MYLSADGAAGGRYLSVSIEYDPEGALNKMSSQYERQRYLLELDNAKSIGCGTSR